ncbi:MAG TPA: MMPL family transporter, partial [Bdellovibrionota bacterium]|nr:MMPL family transporter [Bdellovibrionota bacterium]
AEDMVGDGLASADELASIKERYNDGTSSILLVRPPEGELSLPVSELCALRNWYSLTQATYPGLRNSTSTFSLAEPVQVTPTRVVYRNVIQLDCFAEPPRAEVDIAQAKREIDESPWIALRDRSGQLSLLFVFTFQRANHAKFGSFNPDAVKELHASAETALKEHAPRARHHWVGAADFQSYVKAGFRFSHVVNSAMILLLFLAFRFCYGTWMSGVLYCGTLILTTIWIFGGKALAGSDFDVLASGTFLILGVSALEDFTFASSAQLKGTHWRQAIRNLTVPSFFTSLTTIVGFGSLCFSDLAIIRRFGAWCALGTLLEWVMLFVLLPAILPVILRGKRTWVDPERAYLGGLFDGLSVRALPRWAVRASLLVFPLSFVAFHHLNANDTPSKIFPVNHPYNVALRTLRETKGWQGTVSLLWDAPGPIEETSPALEKVASRMSEDRRLRGTIVGFETADRAERWLNRQDLVPPQVAPHHFRRTLQYDQLVDPKERPRATLYLRDNSALELQELKKVAAENCPKGECHVGGDLIAYADFATMVPKTLFDVIHSALLLVGLIIAYLAFAVGQQRYIPQLLASAFWGPCLMVVVLAALGIPMDFLKCIFAGVLVGMTGDNAVQFLFAARGKSRGLESGIAHCGGASIQTNLCMALTALMYLGSYFDPPKTFGLILASGLVATLLGDLWLLNGYLGLGKRPAPETKSAAPWPSAARAPGENPAPL